jgi:hypothetical protein
LSTSADSAVTEPAPMARSLRASATGVPANSTKRLLIAFALSRRGSSARAPRRTCTCERCCALLRAAARCCAQRPRAEKIGPRPAGPAVTAAGEARKGLARPPARPAIQPRADRQRATRKRQQFQN